MMFYRQVNDKIKLSFIQRENAGELFHLIDDSRAFLREWLDWVDIAITEEDALRFIQSAHKKFADGKALHCCIWYQGELAGVVELNNIDRFTRKAELGYWLGEAFRGKGIATASAAVMVNCGFNTLNLNRIEAFCVTNNVRSNLIPMRLGFTQEGVMRESVMIYDQLFDLVVYGKLRGDHTDEG